MEIKDKVVSLYCQTHTIRSVAITLSVSEQFVRKTLIDAGEYTNARIQDIHALYEAGKSVEEICEEFGIKRSAVYSTIPYTKGSYKNEPTKNALRIRKHRSRKGRG